MSIPLTVHSLWLPPPGACLSAIPADARENVRLWTTLNPGLVSRSWTAEDFPSLYAAYAELDLERCVRKCRFPAMQSDLIRLAILHMCGGVWTDLKNRPVQSVLDLIQDAVDPVLCEHWPTADRPHPVNYVCNSWIASPRGASFILDVLAEGCRNVSSGVTQGGVFAVTGGALIMKMIKRAEASGKPCQYKLLAHAEIWGARMVRSKGSYNAPGQHWSERQKHEPLYTDDDREKLPA